MKLAIFFLLCLSVRLEETNTVSVDNNSEIGNIESTVPRKLKGYESEDDKRKLSLIAQNMAKSLNLPSSNPYSISNLSNTNNGNGMMDLQQLQQELNNQKMQNQALQMQSKIKRLIFK